MNIRKQRKKPAIICKGKIAALEQQGNSINATVQIPFLAKIINKEYEHFIIRYYKCYLFQFSGWYSNHYTDDLELTGSIPPCIQNCDFQVNVYIKLYCTIQDSFEAELHIKA